MLTFIWGKFGLGLDLGTTTVQARLINLDTGEIIDEISALNSQRSFGADVMSRIGAARDGKTNELFAVINNQTEGILRPRSYRRHSGNEKTRRNRRIMRLYG